MKKRFWKYPLHTSYHEVLEWIQEWKKEREEHIKRKQELEKKKEKEQYRENEEKARVEWENEEKKMLEE